MGWGFNFECPFQPDPKVDSLTFDVCDGFADLKNLFGQHYQAHHVELKSLKKNNSRFHGDNEKLV